MSVLILEKAQIHLLNTSNPPHFIGSKQISVQPCLRRRKKSQEQGLSDLQVFLTKIKKTRQVSTIRALFHLSITVPKEKKYNFSHFKALQNTLQVETKSSLRNAGGLELSPIQSIGGDAS